MQELKLIKKYKLIIMNYRVKNTRIGKERDSSLCYFVSIQSPDRNLEMLPSAPDADMIYNDLLNKYEERDPEFFDGNLHILEVGYSEISGGMCQLNNLN